MTIQKEPSNNTFLTTQEQDFCVQAAKGEAPYSQRALALLALNDGNTQSQAAEKTGLSVGQVRYWVARFRKQSLGIFPDALLNDLDAKSEVKIADSMTDKLKAVKDKKGKKTKKKSKKTKKDKKDKKSKKGKKSKKKAKKAKKK